MQNQQNFSKLEIAMDHPHFFHGMYKEHIGIFHGYVNLPECIINNVSHLASPGVRWLSPVICGIS